MVCSNGMVVSEEDFGSIHIRHIGFQAEHVKDASRKLVMNASKLSDKINTWKSIDLVPKVRQSFFTDAARIRFGNNTTEDLVQEVSRFRRPEDKSTDLWTTFNVAQENIIRGGFRNGATRRMVRPISNIQKDVKFNSELWDLASKYSRDFVSLN